MSKKIVGGATYGIGGGNHKNAKVKLTPTAGGYCNDAAAIDALPNDWVPKHGTHTLTNYLKEREQNHNKALETLYTAASVVNSDIEKAVRELAEVLLDHIQHNQKDVDVVVAKCNQLNPSEVALSPDARNAALKQIKRLIENWLEEIVTFRQNALKLENKRTDRLKDILRKHFEQVIRIGHHPPKVLKENFDSRMYEYNEMLYSNMRAYEELEAELKADANDYIVRTRSVLNQMCLGIRVQYCTTGSARRPSDRRHITMRSLSADPKNLIGDPIIKSLLGNAHNEIKKCITQLVEAYRQGVLNVFAGFKGQLKDLRKNLGFGENKDKGHDTQCYELGLMIDSAFSRISTTILGLVSTTTTTELIQATKVDIVDLEMSLVSLGECLRDTYKVLHDAGHLWDAHMMRAANAQKLTITAVEDLLTNNDMEEQTNEVIFNLTIEQMIKAPDENSLNTHYQSILGMLDRTAETYERHRTIETERLEQFMMLPPLMAKVLFAEFKCFLDKNRKTPVKTLSCGTPPVNALSDRTAVPRAILQTEIQEISLNNWRNGFLEALENSVNQIPEELVNQARLWVNERMQALQNRYTMKQLSHIVRGGRIQAMYMNRLNELRNHNGRLKSHLDAVNELLKSTAVEISEFLNTDSPKLYPLRKWLQSIDESMQSLRRGPDVDLEVQRLKMNSYALRLSKHRLLFEQSLDRILQEYRQELEHRLQNARISNVRYMSSVRLFYERGNYSVEEARRVMANLLKASESLEGCENSMIEALNNRRTQLLALADQNLLPLQKVVQTFVSASANTKHGKLDKIKSGFK